MALPFQLKEWPSIPTDEIGEDRWESEGGAPLPDRDWVRVRYVRDQTIKNFIEAFYAQWSLPRWDALKLMPPNKYASGGPIKSGQFYRVGEQGREPLLYGATRTGRFPSPPETQEPRRSSVTITINSPLVGADLSEIEKRVLAMTAALGAPYTATPQPADPYAEAVRQMTSKGTVSAEELRQQLRKGRWRRMLGWIVRAIQKPFDRETR